MYVCYYFNRFYINLRNDLLCLKIKPGLHNSFESTMLLVGTNQNESVKY